ncbi:MAG: DHA2 family efflux MFS transporter permease subunit, partial [Nitrospirae bacterium]
HGIAMGVFGLSASFAPALGPALGGLITETLSWRWVFYVNVPTGLLDIALVWLLLENRRPAERPPRFDWIGFSLLAVAVSSLIVVAGKGQELGWLTSEFIFRLVVVMALSGVAAALWLALAPNPLFSRRVLGARPFRLGLWSMALLSINAYGFFLLLPVFLQRIHGYTTLQSGLILLPGALLSALVTVFAGALSDRFNPKWIAVPCLLVMAAASWLFHADVDTPHRLLVLDYVAWGAFVGATFAPVTVIALGTLEERDISDGSTLLNIVRLITGSIGSAYATTLLTSRTDRFYTGLADRLDWGRAQEIGHRLAPFLGGPRSWFDPDAWARFAAGAQGILARRAAAYAFHATYQHLALFAVAAAFVVLLVRRLPHRSGRVAVH